MQICYSCPSLSYIDSYAFLERWKSLLDYYYNNCFWWEHFKPLNDINVSYILLNKIIKNQEAVLYSDLPPFINRGGISISPNYFLYFSFPCHSFRLLNTSYYSRNTLVQVLQIWIICLKDVNRDSMQLKITLFTRHF